MTARKTKPRSYTPNKCVLFSPCVTELPKLYYSQEHRIRAPLDLQARYLALHNKRMGFVKPYGKVRTWDTALRNGHTDTEVFVYANSFKPVLKTNRWGNRVTEFESYGAAPYVVFDLDNSILMTIPALLEHFTRNKIPLPGYITQTSFDAIKTRAAFHLVYKLNLMPGEMQVTKEDALLLAMKISMTPINQLVDGSTAQDYLWRLKDGYFDIDRQYLNQDPRSHKFRVPGSPKIKDKEIFICRGWKNYSYKPIDQLTLRASSGCYEYYGPVHMAECHDNDGLYIDGLDDIIGFYAQPEPTLDPKTTSKIMKEESIILPQEQEPITIPIEDNKDIGYWSEYLKDFTEEIAKVLPKRYVNRYAEWLMQNTTFLKQGKCSISQMRLSNEINVTQATVSKHLKLLIEAGVLWTNHYYTKTKLPKTYRLGRVMLNRMYTIDSTYDIGEEYTAGSTNDQMMGDIRHLHSAGIDKEEIVTLIDIKMQTKPCNRRKVKEIEKAVDRWEKKCNYKKPPIPLLDFDDLNRQVIGVEYNVKVFRFKNRDRARTENF